MNFSLRDKSILIGLYLSKFDLQGIEFLGFSNFTEAWNVFGLSIGVKPASIKNYRDEFDPFFSNNRKGWHKRKTRKYCLNIYNKYKYLNIKQFSEILKKIVYKNNEIEILKDNVFGTIDKNSSFAKRLITGQSAEEYFKSIYRSINIFKDYKIEDTTKYGCGFDFKLYKDNKEFLGVEVKGLFENKGSIQLTSKEYFIAKFIKKRYFLFVVKNFKDEPSYKYYQNPLNSNLIFEEKSNAIIQTYWSTKI